MECAYERCVVFSLSQDTNWVETDGSLYVNAKQQETFVEIFSYESIFISLP